MFICFLVGCETSVSYCFVYNLNKDNDEAFMDITIEDIDGKRYAKYELEEEGYVKSLIMTISITQSH